MKNQKGIAHIFLILFLLAGLVVAIYLVQQKTNILPKADEPKIACNEVPDMPSRLNGECASGSGTADLFWKGGNVCDLVTTYYVRYIKPDGTWWPEAPKKGENPQKVNDPSAVKIGYKAIEIGEGKSIKTWGVYACNKNGCSDFASSNEVVNCGDTSIVPSPTPNLLGKPETPIQLDQTCDPSGLSVLLRWAPSPNKNFIIRLQDITSPGGSTKEIETNTTKSSYKLTTINPGFSYRWWVYAVENGIRSDKSDMGTFTCDEETVSFSE